MRTYRAAGVMKDGRRFGGPPKPHVPPAEPVGKVNLTDPDCRLQKVREGWVQGYNAQAVVNEQQIVLAAEVTVDSPEYGHLGPMVEATRTPARPRPGSPSVQTLCSPTPATGTRRRCRRSPAAGCRYSCRRTLATAKARALVGSAGWYSWMRTGARPRTRRRPIPKTPRDDRAGVRRSEIQPWDRSIPPTRQIGRVIGVAAGQRHPQPPETPPPQDLARHRVRSRGQTPRKIDRPASDAYRGDDRKWLSAQLPDSHINEQQCAVSEQTQTRRFEDRPTRREL